MVVLYPGSNEVCLTLEEKNLGCYRRGEWVGGGG